MPSSFFSKGDTLQFATMHCVVHKLMQWQQKEGVSCVVTAALALSNAEINNCMFCWLQHGVGVEFVRVLPETHAPILTNVFSECAPNDDVVSNQCNYPPHSHSQLYPSSPCWAPKCRRHTPFARGRGIYSYKVWYAHTTQKNVANITT